jgi:acyl-coenzyme A synthetase/AMP-(fatty) acid ligase
VGLQPEYCARELCNIYDRSPGSQERSCRAYPAAILQEHVKQLTAPYKYRREIAFVTALPKTISGKIRRVELRQRDIARKTQGGQ